MAWNPLARSGTRVILFAGNHDPQPGPYLPSIGVETSRGPRGIDLGPHRIWLEHGDLVDPRGMHHRMICRVARMPLVAALGRQVPSWLSWKLARWYASHPHDYGERFPQALLEHWLPEKAEEGYDTVIVGHYHRAVVHRSEHARLFALGDWVRQRTYLKYDGDFQLLRDQGPAQQPLHWT